MARRASPSTTPADKPRAWQRMLSGRRLDLLDIEIEDIAHGLARVARWNGQPKVSQRTGRCRAAPAPGRA